MEREGSAHHDDTKKKHDWKERDHCEHLHCLAEEWASAPTDLDGGLNSAPLWMLVGWMLVGWMLERRDRLSHRLGFLYQPVSIRPAGQSPLTGIHSCSCQVTSPSWIIGSFLIQAAASA